MTERRARLYQTGVEADANSSRLCLTILFTTTSATLAALRKANELTSGLASDIQIVAPRVIPYPLQIDRAQAGLDFRLKQFRERCEREMIEARIEVKLCRDVCDCLLRSLPPHSLVLIGNRNRWWLLSSFGRWGRALKRAGHEVVFLH